jgi:hypothetical protein
MRVSILGLFPRFYDERQTASAAVYVGHLDRTLIGDGTYFVHEFGAEIVAWRRVEPARQALQRLRTGRG